MEIAFHLHQHAANKDIQTFYSDLFLVAPIPWWGGSAAYLLSHLSKHFPIESQYLNMPLYPELICKLTVIYRTYHTARGQHVALPGPMMECIEESCPAADCDSTNISNK